MIARRTPPPTKPSGTVELGPIAANACYPLPVFRALTGLSKSAVRQARRNGLLVRKVGRREYVRGSDWDAYLASAETVAT